MKCFIRFATVLLIISILPVNGVARVFCKDIDENAEKKYINTSNHLMKQDASAFSDTMGEWLVMALARWDCGTSQAFFDNYYNKVVNTLKEKNGVITRNKYTMYSKTVITLTSMGKNVEDVGGYNLLEYIGDYNKLKYQGVNGVIWGLIALDCNNYSVPQNHSYDVLTTRQMLIDYILDRELSVGGWSLSGAVPDCDVTAMAVTALSKYYNTSSKVKKSIDTAVSVLSQMQSNKGTYSNSGVENSESLAQVIVCLCSLGINPYRDKRFIKGGNNLIDLLLEYSSGNGFSHEKNGSYNQMSTEQCFYALVAYKRLAGGKKPLFDMTDVFEKSNNTTENTTVKTTEKAVDNGNNKPSHTDKGNVVVSDKKSSKTKSNNISKEKKVENTTASSSSALETKTTENSESNNALLTDGKKNKIDSLNEDIKSLTNHKATKKDKEKIEEILQAYNSLSEKEKKKIKGIEAAKKANAEVEKSDSSNYSIALPVLIVVGFVLTAGIICLFIFKRKKNNKENKQ